MKLKDNSTLSCCEYVFIYILTAIITGFIFRFTSSKILPVKYMFAQNITICITYVIVTVISIAITYRTERTKTAIVRNIMATICLITLVSMAGASIMLASLRRLKKSLMKLKKCFRIYWISERGYVRI